MSAANSDMKLATMSAPQPKPRLFLDELKVDETGSVIDADIDMDQPSDIKP
ncbi:hypothetical protein Tco_1554932, partial [Tanacetum coccineum]